MATGTDIIPEDALKAGNFRVLINTTLISIETVDKLNEKPETLQRLDEAYTAMFAQFMQKLLEEEAMQEDVKQRGYRLSDGPQVLPVEDTEHAAYSITGWLPIGSPFLKPKDNEGK